MVKCWLMSRGGKGFDRERFVRVTIGGDGILDDGGEMLAGGAEVKNYLMEEDL